MIDLTKKKSILKIVITILLITLVITLIVLKVRYGRSMKHTEFELLKRLFHSYGKWSKLIFLLIYGLKPLVVIIPASVLSIAAGTFYGPLYGTILSVIGVFLAGTTGFYLARFLGKDFVDKMLKGKVAKIEGDIEKRGFEIILFMRLSVIFPLDVLSYAAGLSKIKYKDFILGTVLGTFPEMVAYSYLGTNIHHPFSKQTVIAIIIVLLLAIIPVIIKRIKNKKKEA